jgi:hypothetical protein
MSLEKRMTIRVNDTDMIRLKAYAESNEVGLAQAVREVLYNFLMVLERKQSQQVESDSG